MAIGQRVNGLPVVSDWHGNKKSPPTRDDSTQDLTNVEGFMNETHTFYAWTRKRLTGDDVGDELIALGPVSVLWVRNVFFFPTSSSSFLPSTVAVILLHKLIMAALP